MPLFFILFVSNINYKCKEKLGTGLEFKSMISLLIIIITIILISFLYLICKKKKAIKFSDDSKFKETEYNFLNYFATFLIPLSTFKPGELDSVILNISMLLFLFIFYMQTQSYFYNIFSMSFNRSIFKDQSGNFVITDYDLQELQSKIIENYEFKYININKKVHIILKKHQKN
nr:hypothetical protein [Staphylococcus aureus]